MGGLDDSMTRESARVDAELSVLEYDNARAWFSDNGPVLRAPLAVEVWLFDLDLRHVLLVEHRWRGWVPPGGKVEPGETPREAAARELFEETGLRMELRAEPAAAAVRSYHPDWPATLGLSYSAVADPGLPLRPESGQDAVWTALNTPWETAFPDDIGRMRRYVDWLKAANRGFG